MTVGDLLHPFGPPGLCQCNGRKEGVKQDIVVHIYKPSSGGAEVGGSHSKLEQRTRA